MCIVTEGVTLSPKGSRRKPRSENLTKIQTCFQHQPAMIWLLETFLIHTCERRVNQGEENNDEVVVKCRIFFSLEQKADALAVLEVLKRTEQSINSEHKHLIAQSL